MSDIVKRTLPTLAEIIEDTEMSLKQNALTVILNQPPPAKWLKLHPTAKIKNETTGIDEPLKYITIQRVEWLLTSIYGGYETEIKTVHQIANSVVVVIKVTVIDPVTGQKITNEGIGACPIQTDKGKGAMEWNFAKANGVMLAAPAAEAYAFKDAAEKLGKIFGRDLSRKDAIGYDSLLKTPAITLEDLKELFDLKKDSLTSAEFEDAERIINNKEAQSYKKLFNQLSQA